MILSNRIEFEPYIGLIISMVACILLILLFIGFRVKKCPEKKLLVIYGNVGKRPDGTYTGYKFIRPNKRVFIYPLIQAYTFLDLLPMNLNFNLKNIGTKDKQMIESEITAIVAINDEEPIVNLACQYLIGSSKDEIQELAKDIISGQIRIFSNQFDEYDLVNGHYYKTNLENLVESDLGKIGLKIINLNYNIKNTYK